MQHPCNWKPKPFFGWLRELNHLPFLLLPLWWQPPKLHLQPWLKCLSSRWESPVWLRSDIQMHMLTAPQMQGDQCENPHSQPSRPFSWVPSLSSMPLTPSSCRLETLGHLQSPLFFQLTYAFWPSYLPPYFHFYWSHSLCHPNYCYSGCWLLCLISVPDLDTASSIPQTLSPAMAGSLDNPEQVFQGLPWFTATPLFSSHLTLEPSLSSSHHKFAVSLEQGKHTQLLLMLRPWYGISFSLINIESWIKHCLLTWKMFPLHSHDSLFVFILYYIYFRVVHISGIHLMP